MRILVFLLSISLGCSSSTQSSSPLPEAHPADPPTPVPLAPRLTLATSEGGLHAGMGATRFNFANITDLWFRVQLPGMPPSAMMSVRFYNPQNSVFYMERFAFSTDPKSARMEFAGEPLPVLTAEVLPGGWALDHYVPIAGSVFQRYPNPGQWHVEANVEGVPGMVSTPLDVEMGR